MNNNNNNSSVTNDGDDDIEMDEESLALNNNNYNTNSNDAIATTTPALKMNTSTVSFFQIYFTTQGGPGIIVSVFLLSVGIGAIVSTVPVRLFLRNNQSAQLYLSR